MYTYLCYVRDMTQYINLCHIWLAHDLSLFCAFVKYTDLCFIPIEMTGYFIEYMDDQLFHQHLIISYVATCTTGLLSN